MPPDPVRRAPPPGIVLRRASAADAAGFAAMISDEAVLGGLLQLPYPSVEVWRTRLADAEKADPPHLILVADRAGEVVAHAGLSGEAGRMRRRHVAGLGIAVRRDLQNQGVGSALMSALCDFADRWTNWTRIELHVFADNESAIALYRRFGFELEGRHRAYALRAGEYVDTLSMARLHPSPPQLRPVAGGIANNPAPADPA
ncbi:MAG: GNAT family N-acetyltransferase [Rubrivivax sp.]